MALVVPDFAVDLTCRSKLSLVHYLKKKFANTNKEVLFRQTCFGWMFDIEQMRESCILLHYMSLCQLDPEPGDTEVVPLRYSVGDFELRFGREEFCLVTSLRFGVDFQDKYKDQPTPLRRRVFDSRYDGCSITVGVLNEFISSDAFDKLVDIDAVRVSLLGLLEMVLLGHEVKNVVPPWCMALVDNLDAWNIYPWGSYVWPTLYSQLVGAVDSRLEAFFVKPRPPPDDDGKVKNPKYSLIGFTWAFKTWILETYLDTALDFFNRHELHPRVCAWRYKRQFKRCYLKSLLVAEPTLRLVPDAYESEKGWFRDSMAFFEGRSIDPPPIPPLSDQYSRDDVPEFVYRHLTELEDLTKAQAAKIKEHDTMFQKIFGFFSGFPNAQAFPPAGTGFNWNQNAQAFAPAGTGFNWNQNAQAFAPAGTGSNWNQNAQVFGEAGQGDGGFPTPPSSSFFEGVSHHQSPQVGTHVYDQLTPHSRTPMPQQGFVPWSGNNAQQATASHPPVANRVLPGAINRGKRDVRPSRYLCSPFGRLPDTTPIPNKRDGRLKDNAMSSNISPLDLGKAIDEEDDRVNDDEEERDKVEFLRENFTGEYISFYNVDPAKVKRTFYEDLQTFLRDPKPIYPKPIQPEAHRKLMEADPRRWSRAHCPRRRYNYCTSNSVESVNACTVLYRKLPVTVLTDTYRSMVQKWYFKRREAAAKMKYDITDWAAHKVEKRRMKSVSWVVHGITQFRYQVYDGQYNREVNFTTGECECRKWQISGIPCGHVIAVTRFLNLTDCVQYVHDWFKKEKYQATYAESIQFVGNFNEWEYPSHIHPLTPPTMDNPQPGRPKNTDRILSQGEEPRSIHCSRCKQAGHNRQNCKKSFVPDPPTRKGKQKQGEFPTNEQHDTAPFYEQHHPFDQTFMGNNQFSWEPFGQNTYTNQPFWQPYGDNTYHTNQYASQTYHHNPYPSQQYAENTHTSQTYDQHNTQQDFNLSQQNQTQPLENDLQYQSQVYQQYTSQQHNSQHLDDQQMQDSNSWFNRFGF